VEKKFYGKRIVTSSGDRNPIWKLIFTWGLFLSAFVYVATVVISCDCGSGDDDGDDGTYEWA